MIITWSLGPFYAKYTCVSSREMEIRRNENNKPLIIKMPGAREKIIVYITHFLVVERSYSDIHLCFWKGKSYVEVSFAANLL